MERPEVVRAMEISISGCNQETMIDPYPVKQACDNKVSGISDHLLLRQFRSGEIDASTELYMKYAGRLIGLTMRKSGADLARQVDPEDIVQSVFRTFFRRVEDGQYDVPEGEDIWKLLLVIALNKIRAVATYHKAAKRDIRRTEGNVPPEIYAAFSDNRDEVALTSLRMVIEEMMEDLLDVNRRIVMMRIEGFELAEIANEVRRSKRTVERVLQNFRGRLSQLI
jgi:RNA polymerase sigma-70 factor (ECF subfamily)